MAMHSVSKLLPLVMTMALGCALSGYDVDPTIDESSASGVYIPNTLQDAIEELDKMLPKNIKMDMLSDEESDYRFHISLGMWIRNNWGLWSGSELADWFSERGIQDPEMMSGVILKSYRSHLKGDKEFLDILERYKLSDLRHRLAGEASKLVDEYLNENYGAKKMVSFVYSSETATKDKKEYVIGTTIFHFESGNTKTIKVSYFVDPDTPNFTITEE